MKTEPLNVRKGSFPVFAVIPGAIGFGFDLGKVEVPVVPDGLGPPIADSVADWSISGVQGENGWCYGYYNHRGEFYDNMRFDLHGQSTSGYPKKSYDVDFNSDHRFCRLPNEPRVKDVNLLSNDGDKSKLRTTLAYETYWDSGVGYHIAFPVRVQRNAAFFEVADMVEDGDDRWLERIGLDGQGALYKMDDGLYNANKGEKKTRKDEDNSDLQAFIAGLDQTGDALRNFLYDHVNLPAMVGFYATRTLIADTACCHKDYYAYRDTNGIGEWWYLPGDVDLSFGQNWTPTQYCCDERLFPENPVCFGKAANKLTAALEVQPGNGTECVALLNADARSSIGSNTMTNRRGRADHKVRSRTR